MLELVDRGGLTLYRDSDAPVQPHQQQWEFQKLLDIYEKLGPKVILEIGSAEGGSLYQFMKHSPSGSLFVSVDIDSCTDKWQEWAKGFQHTLGVVKGDSAAPDIIETVKSVVPSVDFLFIDGGHDYEHVKSDFLNYGPLVRSGGLIVLHDIIHSLYGIHKFWSELCRCGFITQELLGCPEADEYGTGVVYDFS